MVAGPLMSPVNLPSVDKIQSKGDKFVTSVKIKDIKATLDSKHNGSPDLGMFNKSNPQFFPSSF